MDTDLSPTARALRALELLQAQPGITGGQLAAQLDVTERAARRYVAILREAGRNHATARIGRARPRSRAPAHRNDGRSR